MFLSVSSCLGLAAGNLLCAFLKFQVWVWLGWCVCWSVSPVFSAVEGAVWLALCIASWFATWCASWCAGGCADGCFCLICWCVWLGLGVLLGWWLGCVCVWVGLLGCAFVGFAWLVAWLCRCLGRLLGCAFGWVCLAGGLVVYVCGWVCWAHVAEAGLVVFGWLSDCRRPLNGLH